MPPASWPDMEDRKAAHLPLFFDQQEDRPSKNGHSVGVSDSEVIELVTAFRRYGFFRIDLEHGLLYATADIYEIFDMAFHDGPLNLVEFGHKIHPDDLPMVMEAFERASVHEQKYHSIFRVRRADGEYRFVRTVGKYRKTANGAGEVIGVTYEFFERVRTLGFTEEAKGS